jgi:hypothetical protein
MAITKLMGWAVFALYRHPDGYGKHREFNQVLVLIQTAFYSIYIPLPDGTEGQIQL